MKHIITALLLAISTQAIADENYIATPKYYQYGCWRHEAEGIRLFINVGDGQYIDYPVISREIFEGVYD